MRAVGLTRYLPGSGPQCLEDIEIDRPVPSGRDLLVRVEAVPVNRVDTKERAPKEAVENVPKILGYDAAGVVEAVGTEVTGFHPGDKVFHAGSLIRPGTNARWHCVDERIAAPMPSTLGFEDAAALPLTSLTAWEGPFERMTIPQRHVAGTLLVLGGAGGVESPVTQLGAKAGLRVVSTASGPETREWCLTMGASDVVDRRQPAAGAAQRVEIEERPLRLGVHVHPFDVRHARSRDAGGNPPGGRGARRRGRARFHSNRNAATDLSCDVARGACTDRIPQRHWQTGGGRLAVIL